VAVLNPFNCPSCGASARVAREPDEYRIRIICKKCHRPFSISFHPDQAELEDAFMAGELEPDIVMRRPGPAEDSFPDAAIFSSFKRRK